MTNEQAIMYLTRLKDRINFEVTDAQGKMDALNMAIQALFDSIHGLPSVAIPSAEPYKGMTNGEVLETIFPNAECDFKKFCKEDTVVFNLNGFYMRVSADWWNSPYEPQESEDKE